MSVCCITHLACKPAVSQVQWDLQGSMKLRSTELVSSSACHGGEQGRCKMFRACESAFWQAVAALMITAGSSCIQQLSF